jgi:hypothetical protein
MYPWLFCWSPSFYLPWSGNVAQKIEPNTIFDCISPNAGNGEIEQKVFCDIASYGKQIGLISEILLHLIDNNDVKLTKEATQKINILKQLSQKIEEVKKDNEDKLQQSFVQWLAQLKKSNPHKFEEIKKDLNALLANKS